MGKLMKVLMVAAIAIGIVYFLVPMLTKVRTPVAVSSDVILAETGALDDKGLGIAPLAVDDKTIIDTVKVESQTYKTVSSLSSGIVAEILVKEGQRVEAGAPLFLLDQTDAGLALEGMQVALAEKEAATAIAALRLKSELRKAKEVLADAENKLVDANAKLGVAKHEEYASALKVEDEISKAQLEEERSMIRLLRALRKHNQDRRISKIKEVVFDEHRLSLKFGERASKDQVDEDVITYDEFVESEMSLREAFVAMQQSKLRTKSAYHAKEAAESQKGFAVDAAKRGVKSAQQQLSGAKAALAETQERSKSDKLQAEASHRAAQHRVKEAQARLDRLTIRAREEGYIAGIFIDVQKPVSSGAKMATIVADSGLRAQLYVPPSWIGAIRALKEGKEGAANLSALAPSLANPNGEQAMFKATVASISEHLNESTSGFLVELAFESTSVGGAHKLRHGMQVRLTLSRD